GVRQFQHLVKTLMVQGHVSDEYAALSFPNLSALGLNSWGESNAAAIIVSHPSLVRIWLKNTDNYSCAAVWEAIADLPRLRDLDAMRLRVESDVVERFWDMCTRLESLHLAQNVIEDYGKLDQFVFPRIWKLELSNDRAHQAIKDLEIIRRCPSLKELTWSSTYQSNDGMREFTRLAAKGTWPELESLSFSGYGVTDNELHQVLGRMKRITTLNTGVFGPRCLLVLRTHFGTIRKLDLQECDEVTSAMLQEILSSCPALEELAGPRIRGVDVAQDPATLNDIQPATFGQLSRLTMLEYLYLNGTPPERPYNDDEDEDDNDQDYECNSLFGDVLLPFRESIDLRLGLGLEKLSSLRLLREFHFRGTTQMLDKEVVDWMLEHWAQLDDVRGCMNEAYDIHEELCERFRDHGIFCDYVD
ncbi:hypothetical protein BGZ99_009597, partial [Dissophora globulifera]